MNSKIKGMHATLLTLLIACFNPGLQAAADPESGNTLPEEVVINGVAPLYRLRQDVVDAESRMNDMFNELNDDDRFDVSCSEVSLTNSRIARHLCLPNFYREATATEGRAYLAETISQLGFPGSLPAGSSQAETAPPAKLMISKQQKLMQKKIKELALENPEYMAAIINYVEMKERYARSLDAQK